MRSPVHLEPDLQILAVRAPPDVYPNPKSRPHARSLPLVHSDAAALPCAYGARSKSVVPQVSLRRRSGDHGFLSMVPGGVQEE